MQTDKLQMAANKLFWAGRERPFNCINRVFTDPAYMFARTASYDTLLIERNLGHYSVAWMKPNEMSYTWFTEADTPVLNVLRRSIPCPAVSIDWVWGVVDDDQIVEVLLFLYSYPNVRVNGTQKPFHYVLTRCNRKSNLLPLLTADYDMDIRSFWQAVDEDRLYPLTALLRQTKVTYGTVDGWITMTIGDEIFRSPPVWTREEPQVLTQYERNKLGIVRF